jgi:hypothetical protein
MLHRVIEGCFSWHSECTMAYTDRVLPCRAARPWLYSAGFGHPRSFVSAAFLLSLKRRMKTQTLLPSAETAALLFWALLASAQITMRKVDGWESLAEKPSDQMIDLAA